MSVLSGVSIVVNNYNQKSYVSAAIESALAQDHPECEVIVVDDASTDGSQELIERYAGRVKIMLRKKTDFSWRRSGVPGRWRAIRS